MNLDDLVLDLPGDEKPKHEPAKPVAEPVQTWRFEVTCTRSEIDGILFYLGERNIHGTVTR